MHHKKIVSLKYIIYFFFFLANSALENFYPMYLAAFKFNGKQIGLIFSNISAAGIFLPGLTGVVSQKKNPYWAAVCGILFGEFFSILFSFRENFCCWEYQFFWYAVFLIFQ